MTTDYKKIESEILGRLNIQQEAAALGIQFTTEAPNAGGWLECFAVGRDESNPSAAVNVASSNGNLGKYTDLGGNEEAAISFWELGARLGKFQDWRASREHYAKQTGVEIPKGRIADNLPGPALHQLEEMQQGGLPRFLRFWCAKKRGVNYGAAIAAGVYLARWNDYVVLAFPAYAPDDSSKVVGIQLYRYSGEDFPKYEKLPARKCHNLRGSETGLIIPGGPAALQAAETAWLCEGATDALTATPHLPAGHVACTILAGQGSVKKIADAFRGKILNIARDCDAAGEAGGRKVAAECVGIAAEVNRAGLPYEPGSKKDLRDFFNDGHDFPQIVLSPVAAPDPVTTEPDGLQITNALIEWNADGSKKTTVLPMVSVLRRIRDRTGDWPRRVGESLFIQEGEGIGWLPTQSSLFGWLQSIAGTIEWHRFLGCPTKEETFSEICRTATAYTTLEVLPHVPEMDSHFYASRKVEPGDGATLEILLDRFSPATDVDRDLIKAAFLTVFWGGHGGSRPCFVITSKDGRGSGKSKLAEMIGHVAGGIISFNSGDAFDQIKGRLLSPEALTKRVAMLDNVKSLKFSWAELEGLITAPVISGKRMYVGEGQRPNTVTWFITLNGANLSTDMAQRAVVIKVKRPQRTGSWEEDTIRFIFDNRKALIADIVAALMTIPTPLEKVSRWATWEKSLLATLPNHIEAQKAIEERQEDVDAEEEETATIEEHFAGKLRGLGYDPQKDTVVIPSAVAAEWYSAVMRDKKTPHQIFRLLRQFISEGRLKLLRENACKTYGRGFVFMATDPGMHLCTDLSERIAKKGEEKKQSQSNDFIGALRAVIGR